MSAASKLGWRDALVLGLAFAAWSMAAVPLLPRYARLVVPAAGGVLHLIEPHGLAVRFTAGFPAVTWQAGEVPESLRQVPFRLVAYNAVLYLALVTVWPGPGARRRPVLAAVGLPLLFAFHVVDLCLAVESRLLTALRPASYDLGAGLDLWFLAVKYYGSFSVLALKQVLPFFLVWGQVQVAGRCWPEHQNAEGAPPDPEAAPS